MGMFDTYGEWPEYKANPGGSAGPGGGGRGGYGGGGGIGGGSGGASVFGLGYTTPRPLGWGQPAGWGRKRMTGPPPIIKPRASQGQAWPGYQPPPPPALPQPQYGGYMPPPQFGPPGAQAPNAYDFGGSLRNTMKDYGMLDPTGSPAMREMLRANAEADYFNQNRGADLAFSGSGLDPTQASVLRLSSQLGRQGDMSQGLMKANTDSALMNQQRLDQMYQQYANWAYGYNLKPKELIYR
jgi:hypothetical protein